MDKERWLIRITVTRDPETEGVPREWDWDAMIGGEPIYLSGELVGIVPEAVDDDE